MKNSFTGHAAAGDNCDLMHAVFHAVPNGVAVMQVIKDEQGNVSDFTVRLLNDHMFKWITDREYQGKSCAAVFPMLEETGILSRLRELAATDHHGRFESSYHNNGTEYWFRFNVALQADLVVVTTEDITDRKQAEITLSRALEASEKQKRLYDSIIGTIPDLIYVFDLDYKFTYANKALLEMWGKSAEDAIGKGLRDNGYEEWHALMHEREIDQVAATKKPIRGTVSFPHAELGRRIYDYIFVPVINENGVVEAIAGSTRDITDIKLAEERLQESERHFKHLSATLEQQVQERTSELQRSNSDLQKFAHVASHDLKEPLRKVKTFLSRLEEQMNDKLDEVSVGYLERIHVSTNRMFTMIEGVLNYSTINAEQHELEIVDINEVVATIESDLEIKLGEKGGVIEYSDLPNINGIPVLIYQLFYNLIYNSLKFCREGVPPHIRIGATTVTKESGLYTCISVSDNGIGFDPSESSKIFETFTRLHSKDEYEGTGLGLSLCKKIVERHGGEIEAQGKTNEGSTFTVSIPLHSPDGERKTA
ncbi:sensor histidine kinase [Rurimicrobium arvi]|uniref:histidine kinase n=1 Tax=Rurimicrobium arvi TaxID=2049916 RepID=A0ABP8MHP0_9BACT